MSRYRAILWTGRALTLIYTAAVLYDIIHDGHLSREIRQVTIGVVGLVFVLIFTWQARIAWKYEGMPTAPVPFRWVVAIWFASLALFVAWNIAGSIWPELYSDRRSSFFWWQFGVSTTWFASRWITVEDTHPAGVGETGTSINGSAP